MTPPTLPEAEQDVLAALYERAPATAREIREALVPRRPLAHASVVTLLGRLERRGLVTRRKAEEGKAFVYTPTRDRTGAVAPLLSGLVSRLFKGHSPALVATLLESTPPNARDLDELQSLIDTWRQRTESEPGGER